ALQTPGGSPDGQIVGGDQQPVRRHDIDAGERQAGTPLNDADDIDEQGVERKVEYSGKKRKEGAGHGGDKSERDHRRNRRDDERVGEDRNEREVMKVAGDERQRADPGGEGEEKTDRHQRQEASRQLPSWPIAARAPAKGAQGRLRERHQQDYGEN